MKRNVLIMAALILVLLGLMTRRDEDAASPNEVQIERGDFLVSVTFEATLEARSVETVMSRFQGKATLIELAPEGGTVAKGDVLVRFDDSDIQSELVKQRQVLARVEAELDSLEQGEIPLELKDVDLQLAEAELQCSMEKRILADTRVLVEQNLVSSNEVEQEQSRLGGLEARLDQLVQRRRLLVDHIHPARLTRAGSELDAAQKQVEQLERQLASCIVLAPCDGLVVYLPLHFANEFRHARVGDSMYPNQPFMCLPDMSAFRAACYVPEADLARVQLNGEAEILPLAYPDCRLDGHVESIGLMAQSQPGFPAWQKFVRVVFCVDETDPRLRPGMSLRIESITRRAQDVVLIPRSAVRWERGEAFVLKRQTKRGALTPIRIGEGNDRHFEVLEGLSPGDQVILP